MAPTTTIFDLRPQLLYFQPIFKTKHVLETQFYKLSIFYLFDDYYFQTGRNIQNGVFRIFLAFLQTLECLILEY
jgi:hypothetical protein